MKNEKLKNSLVIFYITFSILVFVIVLIIPVTREIFKDLSTDYKYLMGFIKFALLATAGELIAPIIAKGKIVVPVKIIWRFIIWGIIGVWITFMMGVYKIAVGGIIDKDNTFLTAFLISVIMNTSFGPTFMALHKCSDKILELSANKQKISVNSVMGGIDWTTFASFTIGKTVPLFWIPAHTITFLLPAEYQVMMAAALSLALGVFLSLAGRGKKAKAVETTSLKEEETKNAL